MDKEKYLRYFIMEKYILDPVVVLSMLYTTSVFATDLRLVPEYEYE